MRSFGTGGIGIRKESLESSIRTVVGDFNSAVETDSWVTEALLEVSIEADITLAVGDGVIFVTEVHL